jgi:hypothetical protein
MLHRFLETLWGGDVQSTQDIARRLDISQEMVLLIAQDLTRKGYLQELGSDCGEPHSGCPDCPINGSCQAPTRHWFLTPKGRLAATQK